MQAAMEGRTEVVKRLIAYGANVNARDDETRRKYGQMSFMGYKEGMKQLEKSGRLRVRRGDWSVGSLLG